MFLGYNFRIMLKVLAVIAVAVVLAYSEPSIAQTQKKVSDGGGTTQAAQPDKRGTESSPLVVNTRAIQTDAEAAEEKRQEAEREHTDRWIIGLTIAIAVCAFLQFGGIVAQVVVYLRQTDIMRDTLTAIAGQGTTAQSTLQAINRQADLMDTQTEILRDSVTAAQASADAANAQIKMMRDKDRARIAIEVLPFDTLNFTNGNNRVLFKVNNFGPTHALNVRAKGDARAVILKEHSFALGLFGSYPENQYRDPDFEPLPFEFEDVGVSPVLRAGSDPEEAWAAFIFPDEWEEAIACGPKIAIELRGVIDYEDVFGDPHFTKFSYDMRVLRWGPLDSTGQAKIRPFSPFSHWFQSGGEEDNQAT